MDTINLHSLQDSLAENCLTAAALYAISTLFVSYYAASIPGQVSASVGVFEDGQRLGLHLVVRCGRECNRCCAGRWHIAVRRYPECASLEEENTEKKALLSVFLR